jgi:hypothetical protein
MKRSLSPVQLESNAVISSDPERQSHEPPRSLIECGACLNPAGGTTTY